MGEPLGLSMSLDELIKKRSQGARAGHDNRGGLSVRGGGIHKAPDRKSSIQKQIGEPFGRQQHPRQPPHRGGFGGRHNVPAGNLQQRRGGFGGRTGFRGRQQLTGHVPAPSVQTYFDDALGNVVVKLKDTEVVTVSPSGEIVLSTGGWFTQTTLDVMNKALGVLQIRVTATGDVRDGAWQVAYGPHLLRFYDGIVLHPKNPSTATQRAPIVLSAMTGVTNAAMTAGAGSLASGINLAPSAVPSASAALGSNQLAASATAASTAAALAAGATLARARAVLGFGATQGFGHNMLQTPHYALAALAAQQTPALALAGLAEQMPTDQDVIRRLKAQGRL